MLWGLAGVPAALAGAPGPGNNPGLHGEQRREVSRCLPVPPGETLLCVQRSLCTVGRVSETRCRWGEPRRAGCRLCRNRDSDEGPPAGQGRTRSWDSRHLGTGAPPGRCTFTGRVFSSAFARLPFTRGVLESEPSRRALPRERHHKQGRRRATESPGFHPDVASNSLRKLCERARDQLRFPGDF